MKKKQEMPADKAWIQTYSGRAFYPFNPDPSAISIYDIAHALSLQCRFGGHIEKFYSVAQHSIEVSCLVPPNHALAALMHDASEAYMVDLPRPIKAIMPEYKKAEDRLMAVLAKYFRFKWPLPTEIHFADNAMLAAEARDLLQGGPQGWSVLPEVQDFAFKHIPKIIPLADPMCAERLFLQRFQDLQKLKRDL